MSNSDLFQAFQMFQQGAKDYAISSGVSQAADAVQALAADTTLTANQKIAQQQTFANQLQAQMAAAGAPTAQISAAVGALAPPKITNAQEALAAANLTDDPERKAALLKQTKDYTQLQADPQLMVGAQSNASAQKIAEGNNKTSLEVARIGANERLKAAELAASNVAPATRAFKALPEENQRAITKIADLKAARTSIANQIDTAVENWPNLTAAEQLQQGKQLIKTLNSTQGSDAVGQEESKRLANKLQFAVGNFTNDNPTQFGRDLQGFYEDAKVTGKYLRDTVRADEKTIDGLYGRKSTPAAADAHPLEKEPPRPAGIDPKGVYGNWNVIGADGKPKTVLGYKLPSGSVQAAKAR